MDSHSQSSERSPRRHKRILVALFALTGWILHDLVFFAVGSEPHLAWQLLPGSLLAILLGALLGFLSLRAKVFGVGVVVAGIAAVLPHLVGLELSHNLRWLPRVFFLGGVVVLAADWLGPRVRISSTRLGLVGGGVACALLAAWRLESVASASGYLVAAGVATILLGRIGAPPIRRTATGVLVVALVASLVHLQTSNARLRRPDLGPPAASGGAKEERPNLLFVVLDTVRADHLAPYGSERVTTPRLDAFAEEHAIRFEHARSTSSWTLPSHASLFTGLLPDQHGATRPRTADDEGLDLQAWPAQPLRTDVPTLAERLREVGYQTAAILANGTFLRHEFGLDRGFEHYDDRTSARFPEYVALAHLLGAGPRVGFLPYRDARSISDLALDWLDDRRDAPFFLFLNYMDAHAPYIPPAPFDRLFSDLRPRVERRPEAELHTLLYDRELAWLDSQLARVLDALTERGLLEDTVVIVTSDHGEAFGEHGFWLHGWNLYEEVIRVPLYVKHPGVGGAGVDERMVNGADVHDLALEALGLEPEVERAGPLEGALTRGEMIGQLYMTDYLVGRWQMRGVEQLDRQQISWIEDGVKYVVGTGLRGDAPDVQAFDLAKDPGEEHSLPLPPERAAMLVEAALGWWESHPPLTTSPDGQTMTEADRERLRGLGYMGAE